MVSGETLLRASQGVYVWCGVRLCLGCYGRVAGSEKDLDRGLTPTGLCQQRESLEKVKCPGHPRSEPQVQGARLAAVQNPGQEG